MVVADEAQTVGDLYIFLYRVALALLKRYETVISSSSVEAVMLKVEDALRLCPQ